MVTIMMGVIRRRGKGLDFDGKGNMGLILAGNVGDMSRVPRMSPCCGDIAMSPRHFYGDM